MLRDGELTVLGRIRSASNATFLCESTLGAMRSVHCVYKPVSGEQPLWDFPDGTLAGRELAAYLISTALGLEHRALHRSFGTGRQVRACCSCGWTSPATRPTPSPGPDPTSSTCFPPTNMQPGYLPVLRAYDYAGDEVILMHADDIRLWRMAVFDVLINNADRKGGHVLRDLDGHIYGVDHGVCLHVENKLRTVLWGWAGKPVDDKTLAAVAGLADALSGPLADALDGQINRAEIAALRRRACALLDNPVMPGPNRHRAIPWPASRPAF